MATSQLLTKNKLDTPFPPAQIEIVKFSWLRLSAAIFAAFIASVIWFIFYNGTFLGFVGAYWANVFLGFSGVFAGGFCLERHHRFLGSVILLIGGVALNTLFEDSDDKVYPLSVIWVAIGGLAAVVYYFWRRPPKTGPIAQPLRD